MKVFFSQFSMSLRERERESTFLMWAAMDLQSKTS
jgi:hypothetical protein